MPVRTTVDIPQPLYELLRRRARQSGTSIRALIVGALERIYADRKQDEYVTGPIITGKGKLGPDFPKDENPHDLVFS